MPYSPTNWVNLVTALGPTNLNKIEAGIQAAQALAEGLTLAASTSIGAAAVSVTVVPKDLQQGQFVAIGAGTASCEIRRITSISGLNLNLHAALKVAHASSENVWILPGFWAPLEWWGAKADNSTDSYRPLINAFLDQSLSGGSTYGLVGRGANAYLSSRPLFQQDYAALAFTKLQAYSPFAIDCTTTVWNGIPNQYFFAAAGQTGTATFDASTDVVTFSTSPGGAQYSDVMFYPRPGATMPGGIEEGRRYFTITGNSLTSQISAVQDSATPIDITSNGSGEIVMVSVGSSRLFWKNIMLHGNKTKALNGMIGFFQQPTILESVRIEEFPVIGASWGGQQAAFPNVMIVNCWTGLEMMGMEFGYFPWGNIEACDIQCSFPEITRMLGGAGENFGNDFPGFHWEAPGAGTSQIQTLNRTGTPTSGTFQLRFKNVLTSAINWNDTAAQLQTKLEAHAAIGTGNVTCTQLSGTNLSDGPVRCDFTVGTLKWELWSGSTSTTVGGQLAVVNSTLVGGTMTVSIINPNGRNISYKRGIANRFSACVFTAVVADPSGYNAPFITTEGTANDAATAKNHGYHISDLFTSISTLDYLISDSQYGVALNSKDSDASGVGEYIAEFMRPSRHGGTIGQHWHHMGDGGRSVKMYTAGGGQVAIASVSGQTDAALDISGGGFIEVDERSADPSAPATNNARLYVKDNGAGKTQLVVRFPTGAIQVLATEP